jgi:diguanylate cyclase (GGDEF)-like protein
MKFLLRFDRATEAKYREAKFQETRVFAILVGFATVLLAVSLWGWDWVHDPIGAPAVLGTRLLMGGILLLYPLFLLSGMRRDLLPWLFYVLVLVTQGVFLYHLSLIQGGLVYGIAGFMYWFILPVFLGLPFGSLPNLFGLLSVAVLPNVLVPLGVAPAFELAKYNAIIGPTCAITIFATVMLDMLFRNLFLYRQEAETLAITDSLTGIANRRHFLEKGELFLKLSQRYGRPISLLMFDIDHFKQVNDRYGHAAGDAVLRHIVRVAADNLRSSDILGRIGGEEFAVILPETTPPNALAVAELLCRRIASTPALLEEAGELVVTVSFGVVGLEGPTPGADFGRLLQVADEGLYRAKREGRNRVVLAAFGP